MSVHVSFDNECFVHDVSRVDMIGVCACVCMCVGAHLVSTGDFYDFHQQIGDIRINWQHCRFAKFPIT